ncbi:Nitrate/nitrite sensor protein NarX [Streptomyces sp. AVP053U2]|nr:Nitrate/nitrite sensor protein NarX [Streptomyces sp. AVP053U2]
MVVTTFDRLPTRLRTPPPGAVDVLVVAVVGLLTASDAAVNEPGYRQADRFTWLLLVVSLVALLWRRRRPVLVAVVTGAACAGWALHGHIGELLNLPVIVALYTVAVLGDRRRTLWTGLVAAAVSGAVALSVGKDVVNPQGLPVLEMLWPLVPLLLGEVVRTRRQLIEEYADRAARAEEEREAERRVHEERLRIARDLHDVVAHSVTAMTVQAGVALDAFGVRPELAREAMRQVRASGKDAVRELRATVTVLRSEAGAPGGTDGRGEGREPVPGLERLADLVERFAGGWCRARAPTGRGYGRGAARGRPGRVPDRAGGADERRPALRRPARHGVRRPPRRPAGGGGRRRRASGAGGFGLLGTRERAAAAGGSVDHGPLDGGGFRVRAVLPAGDAVGGG